MKTENEINFEKEFEIVNKNFNVDVFENLILQDIAQRDEDTQIKLNKNLTAYFYEWMIKKLKAKEQVKINVKGETRSGKSLIGLKIMFETTKFYENKSFDTDKIICANQKELRVKLQDCEFGDSFQIDERAFGNSGLGSMTELQQLKDIDNIIAKNNNHLVYITPRTFFDTGATLGLSYYGKDTKNWLSRFLLYSLKGSIPHLLGYVIFDVGSLFRETGCFIYKFTGGCTNPQRLSYDDLKKLYSGLAIEKSSCIPKSYDEKDLIDSTKQCPFYKICSSQMCRYEHKKDKWIEREMKGGFNERDIEKYEISMKIFSKMAQFNDEKGILKLNASNGKELKLKIKMLIPRYTNAKLTGVEIEEILQTLISMTNLEFFVSVCDILDLDPIQSIKKINLPDFIIDEIKEIINEIKQDKLNKNG